MPVFDFRPYYVGADIKKGMEIPEGQEPTTYETIFIMQKDGVEKEFSLEEKTFTENDIHIHVPEGAIPKDGPSAGIAILTALVSSFTGRKVKNRLAMTGEITLRGKLLPVGGIKEKILAAKRAGIKEIILCVDNQKDVNEIQQEYLDGLQFHFVRNMADALEIAIEK